MTDRKTIYLLLIGFVLSSSGCSIFRDNTITDGWSETDINSKVLYNKLIDTGKDDTKIYGNIKTNDNENVGLVLFFKNIDDDKNYGFQTDFDGNYNTSLEKGIYDLTFREKVILSNIIVKNGDQRKIDFELIIGPVTTISVEYPNKRAWRKARSQREKNKK